MALNFARTAPLMRRALAFVLAGVLACAAIALASCSGESASKPSASAPQGQTEADGGTGVVEVCIGALKGPTGMGLAGMMGDAPSGASAGNAYSFKLAGSADELAPMLIQGDIDICMLPANLAAILHQKTEGAVRVVAVNTLGVLDIVTSDEGVQGIADLKGRTIFSAGKGSTPEYALRYLLENNGIDPDADVRIEWKSEHAECLAALAADSSAVAMLPQPFATSALSKVEGARIAIDLNDAWNDTVQAAGGDAALVTGVAVTRASFAEEHPEALAAFLADYEQSVAFVNDDVAAAAQTIGDAGIIDASVAEAAIPYCNIVCWQGGEMKSALSGYLQTLYDAAPESVGGAMPGDDFYYGA